MTLNTLLPRLHTTSTEVPALIWQDVEVSYGALLKEARTLRGELVRAGIGRGAVISLEGDLSPRTLAALLALIDLETLVVPLAIEVAGSPAQCSRAQVESRVVVADEALHVFPTGRTADHQLYDELRVARHPGVVLFSSGSDGPPKAAVHDLVRLTSRYQHRGRSSRVCAFLAFDHIGGLNTLLYVLANRGCLVVPNGRSPDEVCRLIETHHVEVLPTTPTFLNLMLLSAAPYKYNLGSLTLITYGAEVMPPATLRRLRATLPKIRVLQTYGLSETGIVATRTPDPDSLWFSIAADDVETRVVGGILQVRAPTTMLGYLEGNSPRMLPDGWFDTGDLVECDGDLIRVLGRSGDLVNIGGAKAHPAEVEAIVLEMEGVLDARASGEPNAITGHHLRLDVVLATGESVSAFRRRLRCFLAGRLEPYKVPQRIVISEGQLHSRRQKKVRNLAQEGSPR